MGDDFLALVTSCKSFGYSSQKGALTGKRGEASTTEALKIQVICVGDRLRGVGLILNTGLCCGILNTDSCCSILNTSVRIDEATHFEHMLSLFSLWCNSLLALQTLSSSLYSTSCTPILYLSPRTCNHKYTLASRATRLHTLCIHSNQVPFLECSSLYLPVLVFDTRSDLIIYSHHNSLYL